MSQVRVFTILGDSNVRRHINKTSVRANPALKAAQILSCGHLGIFKEVIGQVRPQSGVCIVSCLTNFLCRAEGPDSVSQRINPVLSEVRELLDGICGDNADRFYVVAPPMYRVEPVWYREGLPEVMTTFSDAFRADRPPNLLVMSSFPTPSYEADGVHLTSYSGLEYLMHLFDGAETAILNLSSAPDVAAASTSENTRVLEDRVMALEQDHRRLNRVVEDKIALDADASDFQLNERMIDFVVVAGLKPISPDLVGKEWQDQALKDVQEVFKLLMGKTFEIVYVKNGTARHKDAPVTYNVQMRHVSDSKAIRDKFGNFFVGNNKERMPSELKKYSIRNRVTPETKVRIAVLQVLGKRHKTSNPDAKVQVIGYDSQPLLKITPAAGAADRRVQVFSYVPAVKSFPTTFNSSELDFIFKKVNPRLCGQLRSLFVVLSDDVYRKRLFKGKAPRSAGQAAAAAAAQHAPEAPEGEGTDPNDDAEGSDSGSDEQLAPPQAPVQPPASVVSKSKPKSGSRGSKRGATSPGHDAPAKK